MHEEYIKYLTAYKPEDFLIAEDDSTDDFFCLLSGEVGIWKGDPKDRKNMVKVGEMKEPGSYFGEMSSLLGEHRTASILAISDVKALKFPGEMLPQMLLKQPRLGLKLCTALADRLRGTTTRQEKIAVQRNEIRDDATSQFLGAKESFQKLFVMLTSIQAQLQHPLLKSSIKYMAEDPLIQGGKRLRFNEEFISDMPTDVTELVRRAYADNFV
jgi:CRP-like cAMP-binding protein